MGGLILGLDPATLYGWGLLSGDTRVASGVWDLSPPKGRDGMRWRQLRKSLRNLFETRCPPSSLMAIAYEDVHHHSSTRAAHVYGGLMAVLEEECDRLSIALRPVGVGVAKKLATGKGNADKDAMVRAASARWGPKGEGVFGGPWEPADDNEADALFVALTLSAELGLVKS